MPGHVLDEDVAVGEQRDQHVAERIVDADDRLADLAAEVVPEPAGPRVACCASSGPRRAPRAVTSSSASTSAARREPAEHRREDPALLEVADVDRAVEAGDDVEPPLAAVVVGGDDPDPLARRQPGLEPADRVALAAGQADRATRSRRAGTAAAARPSRRGSSGGSARSSRR